MIEPTDTTSRKLLAMESVTRFVRTRMHAAASGLIDNASRPRRSAARAAALLVAVSMCATGCRFERIWTGIDIRPDGTIKLAAEEPMCGCFSVVNVSPNDVILRATQREAPVGDAPLKAGERQRFRFDWGGPTNEDFYVVTVTSPDGAALDPDDVLEVEDRPRWVECETASCEFGALRMNTVGKEQ